jgi:phosphoglycolate phosphatase-like HAD superfamily hydrolase
VGDTWYDIEMGRRAGVRTCGVTYGNGSREELMRAGADFLVDDFGELLKLVGGK